MRFVPALRSPHDREIARLAIPALGSLVAEPLYILADTAIVGRLGTDELAGLDKQQRRERLADQFIRPETTNPLLRRLSKEKKP